MSPSPYALNSFIGRVARVLQRANLRPIQVLGVLSIDPVTFVLYLAFLFHSFISQEILVRSSPQFHFHSHIPLSLFSFYVFHIHSYTSPLPHNHFLKITWNTVLNFIFIVETEWSVIVKMERMCSFPRRISKCSMSVNAKRRKRSKTPRPQLCSPRLVSRYESMINC